MNSIILYTSGRFLDQGIDTGVFCDILQNFGKEITIMSSNIPDGCKSAISYPALDIFTSILRELSSIVAQHLKRTYKLQFLSIQDHIKWVLTVPALWKATARNFMRQAARLVRFGYLKSYI